MFAWLPLSPLRPWAIEWRCRAVVSFVVFDMESRPENANGWGDCLFADQRRPVSKHIAHCRTAGRVPRHAGWPGRDKRGKLFGKSLDRAFARIADGYPQYHFTLNLGPSWPCR